MPAAIPIITAIAGAFSAATSIKSLFSGGPSQPKQPDQAALAKAAQDQAAKDNASLEAQKMALLRRTAPDAQANTGGALTDEGFAQEVATLAGIPGDAQLFKRLFGSGGSGGAGSGAGDGTSAPAPGTQSPFPALASMLQGGDSSSGGTISGGNNNASSPEFDPRFTLTDASSFLYGRQGAAA